MASKKITELQTLSIPASEDILLVIDDPNGTPTSKKITLKNFLGQLPSNTSISGKLTVTGNTTLTGSNTYVTSNVNVTGTTIVGVLKTTSNGVIIANRLTPANSTITVPQGKVFYDQNYLYVAVANNTVKRISLSSF